MKVYPRARRIAPRHSCVPAFVPVLHRSRRDGWTAARQARFLAALAVSRSVAAAARKVGMARETAYRLRRKAGAESFAAAWARCLGRAAPRRKVTVEERGVRFRYGLLKPRLFRGNHVATERNVDNSALLGFLAQIDRAGSVARALPARSQSFTGDSASAALPRTNAGPPLVDYDALLRTASGF